MSKENKPRKALEKLRKLDRTAWLIIGGSFVVLCLPYILTQFEGFVSFNTGTGAIGDTIGGITAPIVGLMGAILVYYALREQIKANEIINDQFKEQKKITYRQNFEQVFFNMLNLHRDNVNNFSLVPSDLLWELHFDEKAKHKIQSNAEESLRVQLHRIENQIDPDEVGKPFEHRAFFKFSIDRLLELIYLADKYGGINKKIKRTKFEATKGSRSFYSYFPHIYNTVFHRLDTHLGHYYRNLYRIVKMIDEQNFSEDEKEDYQTKYLYASIVRSQLSDHEIQWLFFNGLFDYGELFKPLIQEYSLLKNLRYNPNETINKFKPYYKDTAFEEVVWIKQVDPITGLKTNKRKEGHERTGFDQNIVLE
jgi:uncharacterized protein (DUF952 family)